MAVDLGQLPGVSRRTESYRKSGRLRVMSKEEGAPAAPFNPALAEAEAQSRAHITGFLLKMGTRANKKLSWGIEEPKTLSGRRQISGRAGRVKSPFALRVSETQRTSKKSLLRGLNSSHRSSSTFKITGRTQLPDCLQSVLDKLKKNRSNFESVFDEREGEESQYLLQKISNQRQTEDRVTHERFRSALLDYQDDLQRRHHELAMERTQLVLNADLPIIPCDVGFVKEATRNEEAERAHLGRLVAKRAKDLLTTQILRNKADQKLRHFELFLNSQSPSLGGPSLVKSKIFDRTASTRGRSFCLELTEDEVASDAHPNGIYKYLEIEHPNIKMNYSQYLDELTSFEPTPISYNDMVGYRKIPISYFLEYFPLNLESKEPKTGAQAEFADCR